MSENNSLRFSFPQLLILLVLQAVLLGGAFYGGMRFGNPSRALGATKAPVKDEELAMLSPEHNHSQPAEANKDQALPGYRPLAPYANKGTAPVFRIKSSSNSEYTLQVASYPEESQALQVVDQWKKKGYMAYLAVEEIPDKGRWYRVNIGNFGDEASAHEFAKSVEEKEHVTPRVVLNE